MFVSRSLGAAVALVVAAAMSPLPIPTRYSPLTIADPATVAQSMQAAGFGEMTVGRQFLAFDPAGDGRAVEVLGDLTTATRIVVLVPGSNTTLADFDRGLGAVAIRAPAVQARAIHSAAMAQAPQATVAVVAWLGYDPPEGFGLAVARQDRAEAGAIALSRFVATLPPHATVVVVAHSYGTVVAARAAADLGPRVTDIVALASPGMGADTVSELRTPATVWTVTADDDWIDRVPQIRIGGLGHGSVPSDARRLPSDGVVGHDGYLVPGSSTLAAVVDVILGEADSE